MTPEQENEFEDWFHFLLLSCGMAQKYGMEHPIGSCAMRNIFREPMVKAEMKRAWKKHIIDEVEHE